MTLDEIIKKIEDTNENLELIVDEWLSGYETRDLIINRINEVVEKKYGYKTFSWIIHENKSILFCDINGDLSGRYTVFGNFCLAKICKILPADEVFFALYNIEKLSFTKDSNRAMKKIAENANHIKLSKAAFINLNVFKKLIVKAGKASNTEQYFARSKEDALNWLVA